MDVQLKTECIQKIFTQFPEMEQETRAIIQASKWNDVCGLPYTLHMDNGPEFRSNDTLLFGARMKYIYIIEQLKNRNMEHISNNFWEH